MYCPLTKRMRNGKERQRETERGGGRETETERDRETTQPKNTSNKLKVCYIALSHDPVAEEDFGTNEAE